MIDYIKFHFGAAPRTGTTWVMKAAFQAGFGEGFKADVHTPPDNRSQFNLTLVRHPYEWLRSYWYFLRGGAVGLSMIDVLAPLAREAQSFEQFVLLYAEQEAGRYTKIIRAYRGSSVIRTEDLTPAIIELFGSLGVGQKQLDVVAAITLANADPHKADRDDEIPYLQEIIQRAESEIYEQYDYQLSGAC